jgi:hypothetical protein
MDMNKIIKYWPFTPAYSLMVRIATINNCNSFGAPTLLEGQEVLKSILN